MNTYDPMAPDRGAGGDWKGLRTQLKRKTAREKEKQAALIKRREKKLHGPK